ncbi:MAG: serine protease [Gomphosphaeria aponina SAG 52.96 = DSM 107014]|uniref:Serine protease n=1 Tax=Gomphosphaeria aponina SAG 52.96 = DSM 107014 TaxID=1521640 RepID=A0A941GMG7_9CHRO|nr:serine protease [Gomphosphaeria aponina SAG 52.96 = DSM 107014]
MNYYSGLTATGLCAAIVIFQPQIATALTINEVENIAKEITVLIRGGGEPGSGVIIAREGNTYYLLTAGHVVKGINPGDEAYANTYDNEPNRINSIEKLPNLDLAVVQFTSNKNYPVATLANFNARVYKNREYPSSEYAETQNLLQPEDSFILIAGWPAGEGKIVFNPGILYDNEAYAISHTEVSSQGYELVYTNLSHPGMSGGPVLDSQGRLIGIHGRADGKQIDKNDAIVGNYLEETGAIRVKIGFSLGIPINNFLDEAPQEISSILKVENSEPGSISAQEINSWRPPVVTDDQSNPFYWIDQGNQLWRLGRIAEAVANFEKAIALKPDYALPWFAKGFALGFDQQYAAALEACNQAIALQANYYEAWRCKAGALQELQRFDAALVSLNQAIEINRKNSQPENYGDWATKGELLVALQQYSGAIEAFDKAIEIRTSLGLPASVRLTTNRGFVFLAMGEYEQALIEFERAITIDSNYAPAWSNKALAFQKLAKYEESLNCYNQVIELNPQDVNAWNNRGMTLYSMGQYQAALASFNQALQIDPNYQPALNNRDAVMEQN